MKIVHEVIDEPESCSSCDDQFNGINYVELELDDDLKINFYQCDDCYKKLRLFLVKHNARTKTNY